ncbi:PREDICTED: uncharacterized protein LOC109151779 [Ipomoea nil]|uniref:uncharacterized protein LOC109151779 n=1 Tax=Ipomoea nil TaxID=35883 RepID=UPI000901E3ED|nr:PREDICTED: uncharacterized protein LOC109151779 [Ipomoea nil]
MRSIGRCYSEHAIKVADSYCSGPSDLSPDDLVPSIQTAVSSRYEVKLSTEKRFLIKITWGSLASRGFSISISDWPCSSSSFKNSGKIEKIKGSKAIESCSSRSEVFWDLSNATYDAGPEPVKGFYILVLINSEIALFHGDKDEESNAKRCCDSDAKVAKQSLISRCEYFSAGRCVFSGRARFGEGGTSHDITIRCAREGKGLKNWALWVGVDDKRDVIQVKRLQWNFRGNQTIFLDGLLVDMMWDVHGWLFDETSDGGGGGAVFMFRTRRGLDSRLWLEEKNLEQKEEENVGFSLLIIAARKNPDD